MDNAQIGVANAHFVTDRVAVGGDLDVYDAVLANRQADDLVAAGITHVLDVRQEADDEAFWGGEPAVVYRWDGIDDAGQQVPPAWFEGVVGWALGALETPGTKLLCHCHMGINRGPSAGFAVLLALGEDPVDAVAAIRAARPVANVWYAEDALAWWHLHTGADGERRGSDVERLRRWREDNPLDVVRIIAQRREEEWKAQRQRAT